MRVRVRVRVRGRERERESVGMLKKAQRTCTSLHMHAGNHLSTLDISKFLLCRRCNNLRGALLTRCDDVNKHGACSGVEHDVLDGNTGGLTAPAACFAR